MTQEVNPMWNGDEFYTKTWVNGVTYGLGGELRTITVEGSTETRDYNERLQLTRQRLNGSDFLRYVFTDPQSPNSADRVNDGRIIRRENLVSGETVTYQYDELQRLASAEATKIENQKQTVVWGLSWDYDGFGNRWEQRVTKGTAPGNTVSFDLSTNRINSAGYGADANGNMTAMPGVWGLGYDFDNRLVSASTNGYREEYAYLPNNRRVWKRRTDLNTYAEVEHYYLYGAHGERIGTYAPILADDGFVLTMVSADVYFGGRPIMQNSKTITLRDRLGSVMARGGAYDSERHDYFPYGEERTPTIGDRNKYGTYHRDQTGLDYADQRYYNSTIGRFLSADPYEASGGASEPASWGRGVYVHGDPVNFLDPSGLDKCPAGSQNCIDVVDTEPGQKGPEVSGSGDGGGGALGGGDRGGSGGSTDRPPSPRLCGVDVTLTPTQSGILGPSSPFNAFSREQQVGFLNFTAAAQHAGVNLSGFQFASFNNLKDKQGLPDRMWLTGDATNIDTLESVLAAPGSGFTKNFGAKHPGILAQYRQDVSFGSLQIGIGSGQIEIDIDLFGGHMGPVEFGLHLIFELMGNALFDTYTDPYKVAEYLRSDRGINVGHGCGKKRR
jgi:RHS repeat-associated protein